MDTSSLRTALRAKADELWTGFDLVWRYPSVSPRDLLSARIGPDWQTFDFASYPFRKGAKNWLWAEVCFPREKCGVPLARTPAQLFVHGWAPFTLWLDNREIFRETHAWNATGPIADPVAFSVEPGRTYRLVLCVEPTELPTISNPVNVAIRSGRCADIGVALYAAEAQLRHAGVLARSRGERNLVERAAAAVDRKALQACRWNRLLTSVAAMERKLAPLRKRARSLTLHLVGHSHIDMDWMWRWQDTVHCVRRDFRAVTDLMDDDPEVTFTHSQVPTYEVVRQNDPAVFAKVKQRIAEGRWENAAATWVEGDLNMADGESIARHMLYAADWTGRHLGSKSVVLWEPDTFGHPPSMPQLARLSELDCYFHMRCNPGRGDDWPVRTWKGNDGTPITVFSVGYNNSLRPDSLLWAASGYARRGLRNGLHVWGIGDHGGALARMELAMLATCRNKPLFPTIRFSTMKDLLTAVRREKPRLPVNSGETYSLFEGCFTTHASIKRYNRRCEGELLAAEALAVMAGIDRRSVLREAWTRALLNQFHDIFDGAAVHDTYIDAHQRAERSLAAAGSVQGEALRGLCAPGKAGAGLVVLNPLGFSRTEPLRVRLPKAAVGLIDENGRFVACQRLGEESVFLAADVPALSCRTYRIATRAPQQQPMTVVDEGGYENTLRVESDHFVIRINKESGTIGSLVDKRLGRDLVAYGVPKHMTHVNTRRGDLALNLFQVLDEAPNGMSAWLVNDIQREENLVRGAQVAVAERGPVFTRISVSHRFRSSRIDEDIIVYQALPRIDLEVRVDWRERGSAADGVPHLKLSFATGLSAARARFEGPFCVTERPADGTDQPTQKWVDVSGKEGGLALYNDSRYGCDVLGGRVRMSLLRNPYGPDAETDNGEHVIRLALEPHAAGLDNATLIRRGMSFNRPLLAAAGSPRPASRSVQGLVVTGADSVVCTAVRQAEHSEGVLVRLYESEGKGCRAKVFLGRGVTEATEVNFLENPISGKCRVQKGSVCVALRPWEVKTLLLRPRP